LKLINVNFAPKIEFPSTFQQKLLPRQKSANANILKIAIPKHQSQSATKDPYENDTLQNNILHNCMRVAELTWQKSVCTVFSEIFVTPKRGFTDS